MNIVDWFDPKKLDHLRGYNHLRNYGQWPSDFIPKGTEFTVGWIIILASKIIDQYFEEKLLGGKQ